MMNILARPYSGPQDLEVLKSFVSAILVSGIDHSYWHPGDIIWGIYQNTIFDPCRNIYLWENEARELIAFSWLEVGRNSFLATVLVRPDQSANQQLYDLALGWIEAHAIEEQGDSHNVIRWMGAHENNKALADALEQHGFVCGSISMYSLSRGLDEHIPEPRLPAGWQVRHIAGEHEFEDRVNAHCDVWHPSRVTLEAYRRMRTIPGYTPELDIAAFAPDGTIAAYCICWLDQNTGFGEFEPVGTRTAFRRQGAGRAVMLEGLRRLKAHGAHTAIVATNHDNEPALGLYQAVGFRIISRELAYSKQLG